MRVIDGHVHFWNPAHLRYAWLDGIESLNRPFLPDDLDRATRGVDLAAVVFVQADCAADQAMDEVRWVASLDDRVKAIVAYAPLENGDTARSALDELIAVDRVKGIRRLLQSEADGFALQPDFVRGVQALAHYDLSFDICVIHHQLPDVIALVEQCPEVRFVLDHGGKPGIKDALLDPWRAHIKQMAAFENVWCKLSGLVTEADHADWSPDDVKLYIAHILEAFGTGRLMFGGDYPVVNLAGGYARWFDTLAGNLQALSESEKSRIYFDNAQTFYRIDL